MFDILITGGQVVDDLDCPGTMPMSASRAIVSQQLAHWQMLRQNHELMPKAKSLLQA